MGNTWNQIGGGVGASSKKTGRPPRVGHFGGFSKRWLLATGEYSESEVYLFSDKMLALVAALFEARERGLYSEEEWRRGRKPTA